MQIDSDGFNGGAPRIRVRNVNHAAVRTDGSFVLYWMIAARRARSNFALDRAMAWSIELGLPLVVLESLRVDYPFASDRFHRFVIDGMVDNHRAFAGSPVRYFAYLEPRAGEGRGLVEALAMDASVVVTDDFPAFFLPAAVASVGARLPVRLEAVDSNGLLPLASVPQAYPAAVHHRRFMQGALRDHLIVQPAEGPDFSRLPNARPDLPESVRLKWPSITEFPVDGASSALARLPIDHAVGVVEMPGGSAEAGQRLHRFVSEKLGQYGDAHDHPDDNGTSRLSPYLHFGHISAHEIFNAVMRKEGWSLARLGPKPTGARQGWWGVGPSAEGFLDQLVVWRELAYSTCFHRPLDYDKFDALPGWALASLEKHRTDKRPVVYSFEQFEEGATHDPLWNAAQFEMRRDGWMHNYMRMLWGKKILEWSRSPREALDTMINLMNRWCIDGRDPNSYAGYMWTLGRYDRPWPERPIYGVVRSMSSERAAQKLDLDGYLRKYSPGALPSLFD